MRSHQADERNRTKVSNRTSYSDTRACSLRAASLCNSNEMWMEMCGAVFSQLPVRTVNGMCTVYVCVSNETCL